MDWLQLFGNLINRVPIERVLFPPRDNTKALEEFAATLTAPVAPKEAPPEQKTTPTITQEAQSGGVSPEQLIDYQKREIGKLLLRMESHYAQRLRIKGIPCDCGSSKHLLDIESLCEETIPMIDKPQVYYRITDWVKEVGPKSTDEAAKSGLYDVEYPTFSHQARDFRKEIIGSIDPATLFPQRPGGAEPEMTLEEAKKEAAEKAAKHIEQFWGKER
ncbi:hypothetical protein ES708_00019 [subsurface metagenome]